MRENIEILVGEYMNRGSGLIGIEILEDGYPYTALTVNLQDYGMLPDENCVYIHHDNVRKVKNTLAECEFDDVVKEVIDELAVPNGKFSVVRYGFAMSVMIELDPEKLNKYKMEQEEG